MVVRKEAPRGRSWDEEGAALARPTIPVRYLAEMVARSGLGARERRGALAAAGLPEDALELGGLRASLLQFERFYAYLRGACDDELFGYLARPVPPGAYVTLLHMLSRTRDVAACFDAGDHFYRLFDPHAYWRRSIGGRDAVVALACRDRAQAESIFFVHSLLISPWRTAGWLAGQPFPLSGMTLPRRFHRYASETRYLFGVEAEVGPPAIRFSPEHLALPIVRTTVEIDAHARTSLRMLLGPAPREGLGERLRLLLAASTPFADCELGVAARRLGMSRATLARRLAALGIRFQGLKDELRRDAAIALLTGSDLPVAAIAERVGFSEASAFQRAFRGWTGLAPGRFRRG
jgi:AraC-like DNA-binding protein